MIASTSKDLEPVKGLMLFPPAGTFHVCRGSYHEAGFEIVCVSSVSVLQRFEVLYSCGFTTAS